MRLGAIEAHITNNNNNDYVKVAKWQTMCKIALTTLQIYFNKFQHDAYLVMIPYVKRVNSGPESTNPAKGETNMVSSSQRRVCQLKHFASANGQTLVLIAI